MNNFVGVGRITKDVVLSKTQNGKSYVRFTLAINRTYNRDESDFISCITWEQRAEFMANYVNKGNLIAVQGEVRTGSYEKDGRTIYTTDVNVNQVELLEKKEKTEYTPQDFGLDETEIETSLEIDDDDLPF